MLTVDILLTPIENDFFRKHFSTKNLEEYIEYLHFSGHGEFLYENGKIWYLMEQPANGLDKNWLPGVSDEINFSGEKNNWIFYNSWEDLIEKHVFPNGKTILQMVFEE